jgi:chromosome segregation ATPase
MAARLFYRDSQGQEGSVELSGRDVVFIGRGLECAIRTDDGMVSRRHSQIRSEAGRFVIEDLSSANGTLVNNVRVQRQPLSNHDVVQCGSLMMRFVDDGVVGTMVLERGPEPKVATGAGAAPYGGPPAMPAASSRGPGGSAAKAGAASGPGLPYGGPPAMPGASAPPVAVAVAVTPAPAGAPAVAPAGAPAVASGLASPAVASAARDLGSDSVMVDLGLARDVAQMTAEIKQLKADLDKQRSEHEREVAEGKRTRADGASLRDKIEELRETVQDRDEQVAAHGRVADELREELAEVRRELVRARASHGELAETTAARDRQLARAHEDATRLKEDIDDLNRQLMEMARTKDEGWKKLNEQLGEIDHLREVINEQERMLEERRVGLISQDEAIKELRADKERTFKQLAQVRAERDESTMSRSRLEAQISALEEENQRLGRLLADRQTGGDVPAAEQSVKFTAEIKDLRVELRKVEADRDRLREQLGRAETTGLAADSRLAQLEVDLQEVVHARLAADSARQVAQDALAKAEVARHKAAEEALAAARAKDMAATDSDDARRELDRLRRRVVELETGGKDRTAAAAEETAAVKEAFENKLREATDRASQAERSMKALQAELDAARTDATKARVEVARSRAVAETVNPPVASPASSDGGALLLRAREVYESINDILSELRNNVVIVQGELGNLTSSSAPTLQVVASAVEALVDNAETAKGALRSLRELMNADG